MAHNNPDSGSENIFNPLLELAEAVELATTSIGGEQSQKQDTSTSGHSGTHQLLMLTDGAELTTTNQAEVPLRPTEEGCQPCGGEMAVPDGAVRIEATHNQAPVNQDPAPVVSGRRPRGYLKTWRNSNGEGQPWTKEELDSLWVGVRRHGEANWGALLEDATLYFSTHRSPSSLRRRWNLERARIANPDATRKKLPSQNLMVGRAAGLPVVQDHGWGQVASSVLVPVGLDSSSDSTLSD